MLDDGVEEIDCIARPRSSISMEESEQSATESSIDAQDNHIQQIERDTDETNEIAKMDEVFEAFLAQDVDPSFLGFDDNFVTQEIKNDTRNMKKQDLKSVHCHKETEVREARPMARQLRIDKEDETDGDFLYSC